MTTYAPEVVGWIWTGGDQNIPERHHEEDLAQASCCLQDEGGAYSVAEDVKFSMDGEGRAIDNVFIERFWCTFEHDHLHLVPPTNGLALYKSCERSVDR